MKYIIPVLICFFLLDLTTTYAQTNTITGSVRSADSGETLPGSNIFIDGTTIGVQADSVGNFTINNIPNGQYELVISFVGFKKFTTIIDFPNTQKNEINVLLQKTAQKLDEISIEADTREWQKNLKTFQKHFLGFTENQNKTEILNPEVLYFDTENVNFTAQAIEPLVIKNEALGYLIKFYLDKFVLDGQNILTSGHSEFSLLEPNNQSQKQNWFEERRRAYKGSFRHFINALTGGKLNDAGFKVSFNNTRSVTADKIGNSNSDKKIEFPNRLFLSTDINQIQLAFHKSYPYLRVDYLKEYPERNIAQQGGYNRNAHQVSFIKLPRGKAIIDTNSGSEKAPFRTLLYGYWGWTSRIPDLLPKNYNPYSTINKN